MPRSMCDAVDGREVHLDLRLVPAALTSWAVTAAGILWSVGGVVVVLSAAVAVARCGVVVAGARASADARVTAAGVVAVAWSGLGFAVAVQLRVDDVRGTIRSRTGTARSPPSSSRPARRRGRWAAAG